MAVAVPGQTCQLGWHQCSDSWFGTRSGRQCCECVFCVRVSVCEMLFKRRPAGVQSWWYGRLGKQEIVGPSRLILPTLPLSWHSAASCCGHGMAASEARWRALTHLLCVSGCVLCPTNHMKKERRDGSW